MKKKQIQASQVAVGLMFLLAATQAFAVDTGASGLNSAQTWMMVWIPVGCAMIIVALGVGLMAHMVKLHQLVYPVIGLIVAGSASAIVGYWIS